QSFMLRSRSISSLLRISMVILSGADSLFFLRENQSGAGQGIWEIAVALLSSFQVAHGQEL
ncbi:MAG: hypothetical protein ACE5JO_14650, partial [Candidatus Binatia bacterium]